MPEALIQWRERAGDPVRDWGVRVGTRKEIEESARGLLQSLREEGLRRPVVLVNGKRFRAR